MSSCRPHGPRTLGAIVEEYMTMTALAASRQEAQEVREDLEAEDSEASVTPPMMPGQHWNHEVHARGAAFGFNTIPFISQAERSITKLSVLINSMLKFPDKNT